MSKKFKEHILEIEDSEYRNIDASSYSLLKDIDESGPMCLVKERTQKHGEALTFGSLVDILLTSPARLDEIFHTKQIEKPTASLLELADALLLDILIYDDTLQRITHENIQAKIKELGLWSKMVDQEKIKAKYDDPIFWDYIKESYEAKGKIIVSQEILEAAEHCADVLLHHEFTRNYFIEQDGVEILKQPSILYKFKGTQCKARIDLLIIDHNTKTIYVFDIKTGAELPSKFEDSFYKFKYYLQVISYLLAVQSVIEKNPEFKDYKIDTFKFLYISKKLPDIPCIWEVPESLLDSFMNGWDGNTGYGELLENYKFAKTNEIYNVERKIMDKKGHLIISLR